MRKKKVFVRAYLSQNLGDDLFVYILCNRYKNIQFYILGDKKNKYIEDLVNNIIFIPEDSIICKILNKFYKTKLKLNKNKVRMLREEAVTNVLGALFKYNILISGSFFMQSFYWDGIVRDAEWYNSKPYIIGCNFGPYIDEEYFNIYKNLFKKASYICFRDRYSYELFKDINQVTWASDIVFSLKDWKKDNIKGDYYVVSVVNLLKDNDTMKDIEKIYIELMRNIVNQILNKDKKVVMMSFCDRQGDLRVINEIVANISDDNVSIFSYEKEGIDASIKLISQCDSVIATRYHAMILGMLFHKKIVPIVYSEKMSNVLNDMEYIGKIIDLKNINLSSDFCLDDYLYQLDDLKLDDLIYLSEKNFDTLDLIFK